MHLSSMTSRSKARQRTVLSEGSGPACLCFFRFEPTSGGLLQNTSYFEWSLFFWASEMKSGVAFEMRGGTQVTRDPSFGQIEKLSEFLSPKEYGFVLL